MELIQQQVPDYIGNVLKGYQFGQQAKANQLQLLAAQQEMDINKQKFAQAQAENILSETASTGDQNALQRLAGLNPARAEGIRKQQEFSDIQGARVLDSYASMPQYAFSQNKWEQMHEEYKAATGKELPLPFEKSPESILEFKRLSSRLKGREQDLKEQYQSAQIKTEGFEQAKYGVDIQKGKQDLRKGEIELSIAEQENENMSKLGLTPTAYKSYQQNVGQNLADRTKPLSQESAKVVSLAQGGLDITAQLKDQFFNPKTGNFEKAKFRMAAAGSILPNALATENPQFLETRRQNLSDLVGRMRSGGAINKDEEKRFLKLIPRFGDGEEVVKYKLNQLNKEFAAVKETMDPYGVRGTDFKKQTLFNSAKDMSDNAGNTPESESNVIDWGSL